MNNMENPRTESRNTAASPTYDQYLRRGFRLH